MNNIRNWIDLCTQDALAEAVEPIDEQPDTGIPSVPRRTKVARQSKPLPDFNTVARRVADRVLQKHGVPVDKVDAELERLRNLPVKRPPPSDKELDAS